MKNLVLYHKSCSDGFTAAWAAWRARGSDHTEYLAVHHGCEVPDVEGFSTVYILDFSYSADVLVDMAEKVEQVILLDHHATAQKMLAPLKENCPQNLEIVFDMDRSGAMIAWDRFHAGTKAPALVQYVQDRDLWTWELPDSRAINEVIQMLKFDFGEWDRAATLLENEKDIFVQQGETILRYATSKQNEIINNHGWTRLEGVTVPCVNDGTWASEIGNILSAEHPFAVIWYMTKEGRFVYSLRSCAEYPDHVDVGELATKFGGGGHKHAAGFRASAPPIMVPAPAVYK